MISKAETENCLY